MLRTAFVFLLLIGSVSSGFAHPGRTASDGCHYCWTNCDRWGEVEGARHCHGNNIEELDPKLTPINSELPNKQCIQKEKNACDFAKNAVELIRKDLPLQVNQTMILDRADVDGRAATFRVKLSYNREVIENSFRARGYKTDEQMKSAWMFFNEQFAKQSTSQACNNMSFRHLLDNNILVRFNYTLLNGGTLAITQTSISDCNQ